jgi:hypothetical protein
MKTKTTPRTFRLGLYDPDPDNPAVRFISRTFRDTPRDQAIMLLAIKNFNKLARHTRRPGSCLGIFPARKRKQKTV